MASGDQRNPPQHLNRRNLLLSATSLLAASAVATHGRIAEAQPGPAAPAAAGGGRPNILVIFGDDIGQTNISRPGASRREYAHWLACRRQSTD